MDAVEPGHLFHGAGLDSVSDVTFLPTATGRFPMVRPTHELETSTIQVVVNWFEDLRR